MIRRGEGGWVDVGWAFMVARCWGCERVPPQVSTGNRTRATIGTYPSCQRCCAASASHSGKTKGARPSPPLLTSLAPTDGDELFLRLMPSGRTLAVALKITLVRLRSPSCLLSNSSHPKNLRSPPQKIETSIQTQGIPSSILILVYLK
jgi:hypothetical protein